MCSIIAGPMRGTGQAGAIIPKLQIAAPFTPATGPRLMLSDPALAVHLLKGAEVVCAQNGMSSAHATFIAPEQLPLFEDAGWMPRSDIQFHWFNRGYATFDDFLGALASRKRKDLRKERARGYRRADGPAHYRGGHHRETLGRASGSSIRIPERGKWGQPYLTPRSFQPARPAHGRADHPDPCL